MDILDMKFAAVSIRNLVKAGYEVTIDFDMFWSLRIDENEGIRLDRDAVIIHRWADVNDDNVYKALKMLQERGNE